MKQLFFMFALMGAGTVGALYHPFWGILLYYTLAVLRPQHLWYWALPFQTRWSLWAAVVVMLGMAMNLRRLNLRHYPTLLPACILLFALLILLSTLTAHHPAVAIEWTIEYAKILFIALLAILVIDQLWQVRAVALMLLVCLGYVAWEINSLYVFDGRLDIFHKGYGGLDNNGAGLMLAMAIPLACAFGACAKALWQKLGAWFLGLAALHAMMMSYSRGAMVSAIAGGVWLLARHRPRWQAAALALALALLIPVMAGDEIRDRFFSVSSYERDGSAQSRFESWGAAWRIVWDHPLLGQGVRNANLYTFNYGADKQGRTIHSLYLQIAADSGVPALLAYGAILALALWQLQRARRMCGEALEQPAPDVGEGSLELLRHTQHIALGCQASLIVFAFGAIFLSLETFELPWILIVLAAVMPTAVQQELTKTGLSRFSETVVEPPLPLPGGRLPRHVPTIPPRAWPSMAPLAARKGLPQS